MLNSTGESEQRIGESGDNRHGRNSMVIDKNGSKTALASCGIIMPISAIDNVSAEHWAEVLSILRDVITSAGFEPKLVSDADEIGIIQKRIVQNLYFNEIVVCDVSAKNPNVMFELGMRLAFDKPTIIIKDDFTNYSFDTSVIEHLEYPRDLRFTKIISFKEKLQHKISATYEKSKNDPKYSTFLKSFGEFKVTHLESQEVSPDAYILNSLDEIRDEIRSIKQLGNRATPNDSVREAKAASAFVKRGIRRAVFNSIRERKIKTASELRARTAEVVSDVVLKLPEVDPDLIDLFLLSVAATAETLRMELEQVKDFYDQVRDLRV
jgi:hypothetical protein